MIRSSSQSNRIGTTLISICSLFSFAGLIFAMTAPFFHLEYHFKLVSIGAFYACFRRAHTKDNLELLTVPRLLLIIAAHPGRFHYQRKNAR